MINSMAGSRYRIFYVTYHRVKRIQLFFFNRLPPPSRLEYVYISHQ